MSLAQRRTKLVLEVIDGLVADGHTTFRPGDIASRLRARNQPMGVWEIRGELSVLERDGLIEVNPETGAWHMAAERSRKAG